MAWKCGRMLQNSRDKVHSLTQALLMCLSPVPCCSQTLEKTFPLLRYPPIIHPFPTHPSPTHPPPIHHPSFILHRLSTRHPSILPSIHHSPIHPAPSNIHLSIHHLSIHLTTVHPPDHSQGQWMAPQADPDPNPSNFKTLPHSWPHLPSALQQHPWEGGRSFEPCFAGEETDDQAAEWPVPAGKLASREVSELGLWRHRPGL